MADLYALTDQDRQTLKRVVTWWKGGGAGKSSRPVPTRRRNILGSGGKATAAGAWAKILGTVPAGTEGSATAASPPGTKGFNGGELANGALILDQDGNTVADPSNPSISWVLDAVNPAYTAFTMPPVGIAIPGSIVGSEGNEKFVIGWPDLRGLPGYALGTAPTGSDDPGLQIPYHEGGSPDFKLDSEDCSA